jgi:hypothetical protein
MPTRLHQGAIHMRASPRLSESQWPASAKAVAGSLSHVALPHTQAKMGDTVKSIGQLADLDRQLRDDQKPGIGVVPNALCQFAASGT